MWVGKHYLFSPDRVGRFLGSEPRRALAEVLIMGGDLKQFSGVWDPWEERRTSIVLKQGWQKRPDKMWGMCRVVTIAWLRTPRCSDPSLTQFSLCALDMCVFPFYVCVCNNCDKVNVHRKGKWVIHESRLWVRQHYDQFKEHITAELQEIQESCLVLSYVIIFQEKLNIWICKWNLLISKC